SFLANSLSRTSATICADSDDERPANMMRAVNAPLIATGCRNACAMPDPPGTGRIIGAEERRVKILSYKIVWRPLDFIPIAIIVASLCSLRASSRDVSEMEQSAAPAGGARNPALGRPRGPARAALRPLREELRWTGSAPKVPARFARRVRR